LNEGSGLIDLLVKVLRSNLDVIRLHRSAPDAAEWTYTPCQEEDEGDIGVGKSLEGDVNPVGFDDQVLELLSNHARD
jgi:hypothetical protein